MHGYPIKAPMLDIHTVGAGGGSIAYVDSGGLLKVGPRSSRRTFPGPVCYDKRVDAGHEPTVTDANVVLQTLNPTHLLGGRMAVRQDLARQAAIGRLASQRLGMDMHGDGARHPVGRDRQHGQARSASSPSSAATTRATTR